jgi:hypothetical protein
MKQTRKWFVLLSSLYFLDVYGCDKMNFSLVMPSKNEAITDYHKNHTNTISEIKQNSNHLISFSIIGNALLTLQIVKWCKNFVVQTCVYQSGLEMRP